MNKTILFFIMAIHLTLPEIRSQHSLHFVEVSEAANASYFSGFKEEIVPMTKWVSGGVASGDFNNDNFVDLYLIRGDSADNVLLKNNGDGTFSDVTDASGLSNLSGQDSGPLFFDYNQDGWLDLIVGSMSGQSPKLYENRLGRQFVEVNDFEEVQGNTVSISAGDYNNDGLPDLFMCRWLEPRSNNNLWKNEGHGVFTNQNHLLDDFPTHAIDYSFTANFTDINRDGWKDLLIASDFGTSQILINNGNGFDRQFSLAISDENGMGSAVADFDNDGDFDWFVSSIYDSDGVTEGNWGSSGNRLYANQNGQFIDITEEVGIRNGSWGWGSSFADFNNDGLLDLVMVNGWPQGSKQFHNDSTRLFMATESGKFEDQSLALGLVDTGQGRGVVCFDYDNDGDIDLFIANYNGNSRLWRNEYNGVNNWIKVNLRSENLSQKVEGTIIELYTDETCQTREIRSGSNYLSQNPLITHFGISSHRTIDSLKIHWPDGNIEAFYRIRANQTISLPFDQVLYAENQSDVLPEKQLRAYPNPQEEEPFIVIESNFHEALEILNAKGTLILKLYPASMNEGKIKYQLNTQNLSAGTYFARGETSNQLIRLLKK